MRKLRFSRKIAKIVNGAKKTNPQLGLAILAKIAIFFSGIGTNNLDRLRPEVAGSEIKELVRLLHDTFSVLVIGVCEVLPRVKALFFNGAASKLNHYLCGVLEPIPCYCGNLR